MEKPQSEQVEGVVAHIIYRNEENGYTVFELQAEDEELVCIGSFSLLNEGEGIRASGSFGEHPVYGRQFRIESYERKDPEGAAVIQRYLGSGAIRGVGEALAARIVKKFGDDTLRILREEPERLAEVKGISERKAQEIGVQVAEQEEMRSALMYLSDYGLTLHMSVRIFRFYGNDLYGVLKENPYRLAEDIEGIGFRKADEIAQRAGIRPDSEFRLRSGVLYVLSLASAQGHIYLPQELLLKNAASVLSVEEDALGPALDALAIDRRIVRKTDGETVRVYESRMYYLELNCAHMLNMLNVPCAVDARQSERLIAQLLKESEIRLEEEQIDAVRQAAREGILILTGGPGTGKTTTINAMIRYFELAGMSFCLAAPTGRAARRMTEATGYEASTIHKLLEVSGGGREGEETVRFSRNEENPLDVDVIIIDEMSMVDLFLMHALLRAVLHGTHLILAGDSDQLPSVGPGDVLRDLLRTGMFPTVTLTRIFRQAAGSDIVVNAHRINKGEQISLENKRGGDFFFLSGHEAQPVANRIVRLIREELPSQLKIPPFDVQVLSPMRKGSLGVEMLNRMLQEHLNPPSKEKREVVWGDRTFREGDKVMQIRNNYQIDWEIRGRHGIAVEHGNSIFNGDMGTVRGINAFAQEAEIEFDGGRWVAYPFAMFEELEHAYAVTVHKSQGSEYPAVILPLLSGPPVLMTRNLLYTAVTRAKSLVILIGEEGVIRGMIDNQHERKRYTSLCECIESERGGKDQKREPFA